VVAWFPAWPPYQPPQPGNQRWSRDLSSCGEEVGGVTAGGVVGLFFDWSGSGDVDWGKEIWIK